MRLGLLVDVPFLGIILWQGLLADMSIFSVPQGAAHKHPDLSGLFVLSC